MVNTREVADIIDFGPAKEHPHDLATSRSIVGQEQQGPRISPLRGIGTRLRTREIRFEGFHNLAHPVDHFRVDQGTLEPIVFDLAPTRAIAMKFELFELIGSSIEIREHIWRGYLSKNHAITELRYGHELPL